MGSIRPFVMLRHVLCAFYWSNTLLLKLLSKDIYISKEFFTFSWSCDPRMASPKGPAEFQRCCRPRLVLEVLLVLLHGPDQVPPLEHLVEEHHQVLVTVEVLVFRSDIRIYRTVF